MQKDLIAFDLRLIADRMEADALIMGLPSDINEVHRRWTIAAASILTRAISNQSIAFAKINSSDFLMGKPSMVNPFIEDERNQWLASRWGLVEDAMRMDAPILPTSVAQSAAVMRIIADKINC